MQKQRGFSVLSLVLLIVGVAIALAYVIMGNGVNTAGIMANQKAAQLVAQAEFIAQRIAKCATDYPEGNNGSPSHIHLAYPLDANPGSMAINSLVCPGNGQNLWTGQDGVYAPSPISDFSSWTYTNSSPVTISISSNVPGSYTSAIATAATRLGSAANGTASSLTLKVVE